MQKSHSKTLLSAPSDPEMSILSLPSSTHLLPLRKGQHFYAR